MRYIAESFQSIAHLIKSNETRPNNAIFKDKQESENSDKDFTGTASYAEAVELIRNGYAEPLEKIKRGVEAAYKSTSAQKTGVKTDIVGYAPCVPNAILGIPQSMINRETVIKKSKVLSVYYDATSNCGTSTDTFIKAGITVLTIINSLETQGYRVALNVVFKNSVDVNYDERVFVSVNVKDWRQPLDLKKITFPFCHPSMLRRIGFKWLETQPDIKESGWKSGYGRSLSGVEEYDKIVRELIKYKLIGENDKYINIDICQRNDFNPQAVSKACGLE